MVFDGTLSKPTGTPVAVVLAASAVALVGEAVAALASLGLVGKAVTRAKALVLGLPQRASFRTLPVSLGQGMSAMSPLAAAIRLDGTPR